MTVLAKNGVWLDIFLSEVDFDIAYNRKVTKHCLKTNPDMHYEYKSKYIQKCIRIVCVSLHRVAAINTQEITFP